VTGSEAVTGVLGLPQAHAGPGLAQNFVMVTAPRSVSPAVCGVRSGF
jgi:hypothetical protein